MQKLTFLCVHYMNNLFRCVLLNRRSVTYRVADEMTSTDDKDTSIHTRKMLALKVGMVIRKF